MPGTFRWLPRCPRLYVHPPWSDPQKVTGWITMDQAHAYMNYLQTKIPVEQTPSGYLDKHEFLLNLRQSKDLTQWQQTYVQVPGCSDEGANEHGSRAEIFDALLESTNFH